MTHPAIEFDVTGDIYKVRRRPNHAELIANDEYAGVRVIDPWKGATVQRVPFTSSYAATGVIVEWCIRGDGAELVVFDDDTRRACRLSLVEGNSTDVAHPPWEVTSAMPYDWRGDTLWLRSPKGFAFASMTGSELVGRDGYDALQENRSWRRATDRLQRLGAYCERVEVDQARMLIVEPEGPAAGIVGWLEQPELRVPVGEPVGRLAAHGQQLVVLREYEAQLLDERGGTVRTFEAPSGFHFVDLDTLPVTAERPAVVVLVAQALSGPPVARFRLYPL